MKKRLSALRDCGVAVLLAAGILITVAAVNLYGYVESKRYFTPLGFQGNVDDLYETGHINEQGI